jgi:hypothetical protein
MTKYRGFMPQEVSDSVPLRRHVLQVNAIERGDESGSEVGTSKRQNI